MTPRCGLSLHGTAANDWRCMGAGEATAGFAGAREILTMGWLNHHREVGPLTRASLHPFHMAVVERDVRAFRMPV